MSSSFFKSISSYFIIIIIISLFICFISPQITILSSNKMIFSDKEFVWPLEDYKAISSYFGKRKSPTVGASSYHSGIDIPAPEGTPIYAICSGEVTFASWGAGGGYTLVISNSEYNITVSYCHISPTFIVKKGDKVLKGQNISFVGPKNVYGIVNNPYKDSNGNPTNGASTGCHLHLTIKEDGIAVNPLNYISP